MSEKPNDLYFVNPWVDGFFIGFGSLFCFLYYRYLAPGYSTLQLHEGAVALAAALGWVGSWPHFSATAWRFYESKENARLYPLTAWLVPALVLLATLACFAYPVSFAPYFLKLFLLWSPWHFSLQTFGITLIYARRAGLRLSPFARATLAAFFVSSFLVQYAEAEAALRTAFFSGLSYPQLNIPAATADACRVVMYASLAASLYSLLPAFRRGIPWILLLPIATQYLWFVHGARDVSFQLLLPLFHGLQYLLIAWVLEVRRQAPQAPGPILASGKWMAVNFVAGAIVFFGLPRLLERFGWSLAFSTLVILAAVSVHHYFVDGIIWKLRGEGEGSPLFSNIGWAWSREGKK